MSTSTKNRSYFAYFDKKDACLKEEKEFPLLFSFSWFLILMISYAWLLFIPSLQPNRTRTYIRNVPVMKRVKILSFLSLWQHLLLARKENKGWRLQQKKREGMKNMKDGHKWNRLQGVTEWWCVINTSKEHRFPPPPPNRLLKLFSSLHWVTNGASCATVLAAHLLCHRYANTGTRRRSFSLFISCWDERVLAELIIDGCNCPLSFFCICLESFNTLVIHS